MFRQVKKIAAMAAAVAFLANSAGISAGNTVNTFVSAETSDTGARIRVDINKNDGRKASYAKNAYNWILQDGKTAEYEVNGVTFRLSNGGSTGGDVTGTNNKKLQLQSLDYPYLTMDGAKIKDGDSGGVLKLE